MTSVPWGVPVWASSRARSCVEPSAPCTSTRRASGLRNTWIVSGESPFIPGPDECQRHDGASHISRVSAPSYKWIPAPRFRGDRPRRNDVCEGLGVPAEPELAPVQTELVSPESYLLERRHFRERSGRCLHERYGEQASGTFAEAHVEVEERFQFQIF